MKRTMFTVLALFAALTMVLASAMPASAGAGGNDKKLFDQDGIYIVQMSDAPVVAYTGGVSGYAATYRGRKIDPNDSKVIDYVGYLVDKHDKALGDAGGGKKLYDYVYTFNGFAAELTAAQANKISALADVLAISADETRSVDTFSTPTFLGLDAANGLWEKLGGVDNAGADIIIGIIDTGIWPESISFSDRTGENGNDTRSGKLDYQQIPGWHGKCTPGEAFNASMCNQKLIGAQWFNAAWGGDEGIDADLPWEFVSPRDYNGHGTHTSSTAGGNNVDLPAKYGVYSTISGMAPHARIAMYKALWTLSDGTGSGYTSDLVAAIDTAVADGVDVISYSISGSRTNFRDPVEISFMYAANAGIFVAASAGNNYSYSTVAHPSPWITTVAAGTHGRTVNGSVTLGSDTYFGASIAGKTVTAPVINSTAAGMPGANAAAVAKCYSSAWNGGSPALDPVKVAGKIVVCDRGTSDRVDKSLAVLQAGGVGMILVNPSPATNNIVADPHSVPSVHLQNTYYTAVHAFASNAGAVATINMAAVDYSTPAPITADFSSRGPLLASGDLLKPDLIAPGVDILAAVAPPGNGGLDFNLYSGTSMSTPHVAGIAALFKQLHPDWTPMMIKSALMTSAYDVLDAPGSMPVAFSQGAGHVQPNDAMDPGLVFNSSMIDWLGFLCGTQLPASYCTTRGIPVIAPSNFNTASIAISNLIVSQTVTRTVTNVGGKGTYSVAVSGLAGFNVSVTPATFTLNTGQKQVLTIEIARTDAELNIYSEGFLTWSDGKHDVRIPVVTKPMALVAPVQVSGNGIPLSYNVTFGYTGPFTAEPRGLVPAVTFDGSVNDGAFVEFDVTIPAGTTYARFSLFDANVTPGSDLDLYVYLGSNRVGYSGSATSAEEISLINPVAGTYTAVVEGYATANPSTFKLFTWALDSAAAGNMTVSAPAAAVSNGVGTIHLSFSGLTPGVKYLGSVAYSGVAGLPNPTIVRVDP